jgi:Xaa-Pro aminopeptidase
MTSSADIKTRLDALRAVLASKGLDGFVVPRADAHQSEVAAPRDDCLAFITGFTGSAGLALVIADKALIFVDGRYDIQARHEVDQALFEVHHLHNAPIDRWMRGNATKGMQIGFDPMLINGELHNRMSNALTDVGAVLTPVADDIFDQVWKDRPRKPLGAVRAMPVSVAGETSNSKKQRVAASITQSGADIIVETLPDNIAWLLNVRGSDVPMNPVPHSFLTLSSDGAAEWFVDPRKLGNDLSTFELDNVQLSSPDTFIDRLGELASGNTFMIDPQFSPVAVRLAVEAAGGKTVSKTSPMTILKASKNAVELEGYRRCHVEDGVAVTNFLAWVLKEGREREGTANPLTELEAEAKLLAFRAEGAGFLEASFRSISASGSNAAMCHYNSAEDTNAAIDNHSPYLIDSGGQYTDGTTDVTRTLMLGTASDVVRQTYTAVLKGFLSLLMAKMPIGTQGHQLDAFARRPLWDLGLDYDHGTGHGVGHNLLIHEYPHRFAKIANPYGLEPGNIMTIEPGYYEAGEYGLRIENQVEVTAVSSKFCGFASLTLVPIDLSAVDVAKLSDDEILYLNNYHRTVRKVLSSRVKQETLAFLMEQTQAITRPQ